MQSVEIPIKFGNLWNVESVIQPDEAFELFSNIIKSGQLNKTPGYLYRLISNFAWILKHSDPIPEQEVKGLINVIPSSFEDSMHSFEETTLFPNTSVHLVLSALYNEYQGKHQEEKLEDQVKEFIECWNRYINFDVCPPSIYAHFFGMFKTHGTFSRKNAYLSIIFDQFSSIPKQVIPKWAVDLLIDRIKHLSQSGWYIDKFSKDLKKLLSKTNLSFETILQLLDLLPSVVSLPLGFTIDQVRQLSPQSWNVARLSNATRAYTLGFPIHYGIPGDAQVREACLKLSRDGPEAYMVDIGRKWDALIRYQQNGLNWVSETEDPISATPFFHYGPFDRLIYIDDDHAFEFTRTSWEELLKETEDRPPSNPFNRKPLSKAFLSTVKSRLETADLYELPPASTIQSLIENSGKECREVSSHQRLENFRFTFQNDLLASLFGF